MRALSSNIPGENWLKEQIDFQTEHQRETAGTRRLTGWLHTLYPLALAILVSVVAILLLRRFKGDLQDLRGFGYAGVFIVGLVGNATVLLPGPSLAFTAAMGGVLNPLLVGVAAGAGEALGELTGYLGGISGKRMIEDGPRYELVRTYLTRYGGWFFLLLAAVPNPLFDVAGLVAGTIRFPVLRFLVNVWIGKTVKAILFAQVGHHFLG